MMNPLQWRWVVIMGCLMMGMMPVLAQQPTAIACAALSRAEVFYRIGLARGGQAFEEALQWLNCMLRTSPADVEVLHIRARLHYELGNYDNAINDYNAIIASNPQDAVAINGRGLVALYFQWDELAWKDFDTAITLKSDYAEAYYNRARAAERLGNDMLAVQDYRAALHYGFAPADNVLWNLALVYERTGDVQGYEAILQEIIRVNSGFAPAFERLGTLASERGEFFDAQFYYQALEALYNSQQQVIRDPLSSQERAIRSFIQFMPMMLVVLILSGLIGGGVIEWRRRQSVA